MNERQQEIEIAKKLGWTTNKDSKLLWELVGPSGIPTYVCKGHEADAWQMGTPTYFTDRNASAEIVRHFAVDGDIEAFEQALAQVMQAIGAKSTEPIYWRTHRCPLVQGAIATPRQIAEAALAVWGIEQEGKAK